MPTTPKYGLRYPPGDILPNVPLDLQHLAEDTEAALAARLPYGTIEASGGGSIGSAWADPATPSRVQLAPGVYQFDVRLGFSLSLAAGRYDIQARLVDEATTPTVLVEDSWAFSVATTGVHSRSITLHRIVTLSALTWIKVQGACSATSGTRSFGRSRLEWVKLA